ncbi:sigma 54-interacting transcriptional regulator [Pseudomonadota bacterium]
MTVKESGLLGQSPELMRVLNAARMVACTGANVLITGEIGSGKESLAREIHSTSPRRDASFVSLDSALISEAMLESQLLGYAGHGPDEQQQIRAAQGGTLFLNKIDELSVGAQARLLHFLENRSGMGCLDVRIVAASSKDLYAQVQAGAFREDLFFQLNVVPLDVPPLRERGDDVVLLLKRFTADYARSHGRRAPSYAMSVRRVLKSYRWPGNVKELRNFCERMVILMPGKAIEVDNLPMEIRRGPVTESASNGFVLPQEGLDLTALEGSMIRQALGVSGGNRSKAARLLGLSRDTLLYRIQKHAIKI